MIKKYKLILTILLFMLLTSMNNKGTYSWFTSELSASGGITNATTDSLIDIGNPEVIYTDANTIKINIPVTNVAELSIPIIVDNVEKIVTPSETYIFTVIREVSTEDEVPIRVIGFNKYIDEQVVVKIDITKFTSGSVIIAN